MATDKLSGSVKFNAPEQFGKFITETCDAHSLIRIRMRETATPDEINALRAGAIKESGCRKIVWDFREDEISLLGNEDIQKFAKFIPDVPPGNKLALVVPNQVSFGISRMLSTHMELAGSTTSIMQFYDFEEALTWLLEEK